MRASRCQAPPSRPTASAQPRRAANAELEQLPQHRVAPDTRVSDGRPASEAHGRESAELCQSSLPVGPRPGRITRACEPIKLHQSALGAGRLDRVGVVGRHPAGQHEGDACSPTRAGPPLDSPHRRVRSARVERPCWSALTSTRRLLDGDHAKASPSSRARPMDTVGTHSSACRTTRTSRCLKVPSSHGT